MVGGQLAKGVTGPPISSLTLCACCVVAADNKLNAADVLALAPTLGKLVALTSLNLARTLRGMRVLEVQDARRLELGV